MDRPRLKGRLAAVLDYPVTLVQAGTGYGKSTALAALTDTVDQLCWYTITEPDRDSLLFLAHLICAFERQEPSWGEPALHALEAWGGPEATGRGDRASTGGRVTPDALTPLINTLTSELTRETVLVLDDYHLVADLPEIAALVERLVDYRPPRLHVVLSCRHLPPWEALTRWRVKGDLLTISQVDLAFTAAEIETLFHKYYDYPISPQQAQALATETEGWAIALQMVWQSLQTEVADLEEILGRFPATLEALFAYLAQDVLARLSPDVQHFLLTTSVLRQMDGPACDYLLGIQDSAATLRHLHETGLFVIAMGDEGYRYHRLFHDFLRGQLGREPGQREVLHRRAADYYRQAGHPEETVTHLLEAHDFPQAAEQIAEMGPGLIGLGRLDSLSAWISRLPPDVQRAQPGLNLLLGDVMRLRARFEGALEYYSVAEHRYVAEGDNRGRSRALRGQAQVYLDTVRPLKAGSLLEEALRLLDPEQDRHDTADLLDKLAENKLNLGQPDEAQVLHHEARLLRDEVDPGDLFLEARAMVRTGRLAEARQLLQERAKAERQAYADRPRAPEGYSAPPGAQPSDRPPRPQRFHRETLLLLSLVHSLQGDAEAAERAAQEGITIGQRLGSAFVEAVGYMRLGHALQLAVGHPWDRPTGAGGAEGVDRPDGADRRPPSAQREPVGAGADRAIACYHHAIGQVRAFNVMRTQVEPLWGLCRAFGYNGELATAEHYAKQALEIVQRAGDEWMHDLVQVTLGASYALGGQADQAGPRLLEAADSFGQVGDPFGQSAAWLWLALAAWWRGRGAEAVAHLSSLLAVARERGYDSLLIRRTFLGLKDDQAALPLLVEARKRGIEARYAARLLDRMGLADADGRAPIEAHPGYPLAVRTLGPFAVWRGDEPVTDRDWRREKARQIFQLLLTYRGQWLYREQIVEHLWPHLSPDAAERDFKVALNALNQALEPERPRGAPPFFVVRRGAVYGLNPAARVALDVDDFERLTASDDVERLRQALSLYEEDYLPDSLYEDWSAAERQRLRDLVLSTAERLARLLLRAGEWEEVIQVCQSLLARDNCWEAAYRLLMQAHAAQGNRPQVHSVYQRCVTTLREELGVEPSPITQSVFEQLS